MKRQKQVPNKIIFRNEFLKGIYLAFTKRLKSLRRKGGIRFEFDGSASCEWFNIHCYPASSPGIIFTVDANHWGALVIRSLKGKNIMAIKGLIIIDNGSAIVEAFEKTIFHLYISKDSLMDPDLRRKIIDIWRRATLRVIQD
jgi:hypothetical protein